MSPYRVGAKNMVDRGKARDVNEAARRFAETLAESYRVVYAQAAESGERQQRLAQEFSELVANNLQEQADRQEEAGRALAKESLGAYMDFLDSTFSQYRAGAMASGQTAAGVVGAVGDATARTMEAATEGPQRTAETATFPIAGYDELNVEETLRENRRSHRRAGATTQGLRGGKPEPQDPDGAFREQAEGLLVGGAARP
jgi:hypothetical protein